MRRRIEFEQVTTRGGDGGETSLYSGERRRKDDMIFEALGDLDELNSFLGFAKAGENLGNHAADLETIQRNLLRIGAEVATPASSSRAAELNRISQKDIDRLEDAEKSLLESTPIAPIFILPGGCEASARIDLSRAVCRRAERRIVSIIRERGATELSPAQNYLNRLSDYLFVLGRRMDKERED